MNERSRWEELLDGLEKAVRQKDVDTVAIARLVKDHEPADIALALEELEPENAETVFATLEDECAAAVLCMLAPVLTTTIAGKLDMDRFNRFVELLPNDDAAALLTEQSKKVIQKAAAERAISRSVTRRAVRNLDYPEGTAGRMMTTNYIRLAPSMTASEALEQVRRTDPDENFPNDMCVVEQINGESARERLLGVISIRDTLMAAPDQKIQDLMAEHIVCVTADTESTSAARLLSKHKFLSLPVTDDDGYLVGVIPSEDLMQVTLARLYERYSRTVGTDAAAMEKMSPAQAAKTRVPWLLGTMVIELGAAVLIDHFDAVLMQVILLAAFMPVISAVSGNAGLQAAAITVRGLDSGEMSLAAGRKTLLKETSTTFLMALACGAVLGLIGGFWSRHVMFGVVIALALICSMMTAAFMGTLFPIVSKKLGFDPATTAGPFETAFQDVVGFGVFLGLATLLSSHL